MTILFVLVVSQCVMVCGNLGGWYHLYLAGININKVQHMCGGAPDDLVGRRAEYAHEEETNSSFVPKK